MSLKVQCLIGLAQLRTYIAQTLALFVNGLHRRDEIVQINIKTILPISLLVNGHIQGIFTPFLSVSLN